MCFGPTLLTPSPTLTYKKESSAAALVLVCMGTDEKLPHPFTWLTQLRLNTKYLLGQGSFGQAG